VNEQHPAKTDTAPLAPNLSMNVLKAGYEQIGSSALSISGSTWERYGFSGGSLVIGGAVAIIAVVVTIIAQKGWTATDLIACLSFSTVLIIIGTAAALIENRTKQLSFKVQVTAYDHYKDGVTEVARVLGEKMPQLPDPSPHGRIPGT
jgi:hypothetical protein